MESQTTDNKKLFNRIDAVLDEIRPFLKADGGDIVLKNVSEDLEVKVAFIGACKICSMSESTFKAGVEENIRRFFPEVKSIIVVNE